MALVRGGTVVSASYLDSDVAAATDRPSRQKVFNVTSLFILTANGSASRVPISQFTTKSRATTGLPTIELAENDHVVQTLLVQEHNTLLIDTTNGKSEQVQAFNVADIKSFARGHKGEAIVSGRVVNVVKL
jgi:DNA gyrase/topoisomerase IV subunit A